MRTTDQPPIVIAAAIILAVIGLSGCSTPSSPSALKSTTQAPPTGVAAATTKAPEPGGVAVVGFKPARTATAVKFAEQLALAAMSGCDTASVEGLEPLMTPSLYKDAVKNPKSWTVLTLKPPMVLSAGCVSTQKLSDGSISPGEVVNGMPSIRVAVTVTEGLMVGTTTSPKTLKPFTATRRYTVDVLPSGTDWLAHRVATSGDTLTEGK